MGAESLPCQPRSPEERAAACPREVDQHRRASSGNPFLVRGSGVRAGDGPVRRLSAAHATSFRAFAADEGARPMSGPIPVILVIDDLLGRRPLEGRNEERANLCAHLLL